MNPMLAPVALDMVLVETLSDSVIEKSIRLKNIQYYVRILVELVNIKE